MKIFDLGWQNNIHTIDTAKSYGNSEEVIGNYLSGQKSYARWNVITKLSQKDEDIYDQIQNSAETLSIRPRTVWSFS